MITIKDIYQRFDGPRKNSLRNGLNLSPIQLLEWEEQNAKAIENFKSFPVGRKLITTPALISTIRIDRIHADVTYSTFFGGKHYDLLPYQVCTYDLKLDYTLFFDKNLYETVKQIYNDSWVEFEGEIISFRADNHADSEGEEYRQYTFDIKLSGIKVISKPSLSPSLLGVNYKSKPKCFIATAAFGNQDFIEVIQLRAFRDNVLRNSLAGRCFISTYCILSPPIALVIRQSNWLRKITRLFLRKVVIPLTKLRTNHLGE